MSLTPISLKVNSFFKIRIFLKKKPNNNKKTFKRENKVLHTGSVYHYYVFLSFFLSFFLKNKPRVKKRASIKERKKGRKEGRREERKKEKKNTAN